MTERRWILIGAGGHARSVVEALSSAGDGVAAVVDPAPVDWLDAERFDGDQALPQAFHDAPIALGLGGSAPEALARRLALLRDYMQRGLSAPPVVSPAAYIAATARLGPAVQVLAGAVVQAEAVLEEGVIVNTGAIVEHESVIGAGAHIGPGAVVLGRSRVGTTAMVGAGSVTLPESRIEPASTVRANAVHSGADRTGAN